MPVVDTTKMIVIKRRERKNIIVHLYAYNIGLARYLRLCIGRIANEKKKTKKQNIYIVNEYYASTYSKVPDLVQGPAETWLSV